MKQDARGKCEQDRLNEDKKPAVFVDKTYVGGMCTLIVPVCSTSKVYEKDVLEVLAKTGVKQPRVLLNHTSTSFQQTSLINMYTRKSERTYKC